MTDTIQKLHACSSCGFISMQGNSFEIVGWDKLCRSCLERIASPFYYEASGDYGLIFGRDKQQAHDSLSGMMLFEDIVVFREATDEDIVRVEAKRGRAPQCV